MPSPPSADLWRKSESVAVRMHPVLVSRLDQIATSRSMSRAELIRQVMREHAEQHAPQAAPLPVLLTEGC